MQMGEPNRVRMVLWLGQDPSTRVRAHVSVLTCRGASVLAPVAPKAQLASRSGEGLSAWEALGAQARSVLVPSGRGLGPSCCLEPHMLH